VKSAPFAYHAPTSIAEAVGTLAGLGGQARLLAGGQTLMPLLTSRRLRIPAVIDLNRVPELSFVTRDCSRLRIGALTRLRRLEDDPVVRADAPLLCAVAALAGPVQVRNRATIGGALAYADPAAEFPAVAIALGAQLELRGDRTRVLPAEEFFLGAYRTALSETELLTAVEFPRWPEPAVFAVEKIAPRATGPALAGAVVVLGTCRVVVFGATPTPVRPAEAESALAGGADPEEVADAAVAGLAPADAAELSGADRRQLTWAAVRRAVATARERSAHV
jgi:carbon-monoxide dehydrogenase medium subunit